MLPEPLACVTTVKIIFATSILSCITPKLILEVAGTCRHKLMEKGKERKIFNTVDGQDILTAGVLGAGLIGYCSGTYCIITVPGTPSEGHGLPYWFTYSTLMMVATKILTINKIVSCVCVCVCVRV